MSPCFDLNRWTSSLGGHQPGWGHCYPRSSEFTCLIVVLCIRIFTAAGDRVRPTAWSPEIKRPKTEPSLSSHKNGDLSLPALVGEPEKFKVNAYIWNLGIQGSSSKTSEHIVFGFDTSCVASPQNERYRNAKISLYRAAARQSFQVLPICHLFKSSTMFRARSRAP